MGGRDTAISRASFTSQAVWQCTLNFRALQFSTRRFKELMGVELELTSLTYWSAYQSRALPCTSSRLRK